MEAALLQNETLLAIVEHFPGLAPTLQWGTVCRRANTMETRQRVLAWLGACGLAGLPAHVPLGLGQLVQLLFAMALSQFRRFDDPSLEGTWWHGHVFPARRELRGAVRHVPLRPHRAWIHFRRGAYVTPEQLDRIFPDRLFDAVLPFLQQHGHCFCVARNTTRHYRDYGAYVEGLRLDIVTLQCAIMGFELALQCTTARVFNPVDDDSSGTNSDV